MNNQELRRVLGSLIITASLFSCDTKKESEIVADSTSDGSDDGSASASTGGNTGSSVDRAEYIANCKRQESAEACNAVEAEEFHDDGDTLGCLWVEWVPTTYTSATNECHFGAVMGRCEVSQGTDVGCPGHADEWCTVLPDAFGLIGWEGNGTTFLAKARDCTLLTTSSIVNESVCRFEGGSEGAWNQPECACLCDEAFP